MNPFFVTVFYEQHITALQQQLHTLQHQLETSQHQLHASRQNVSELNQELATLKIKLQHEQTHNAQLEAEINTLTLKLSNKTIPKSRKSYTKLTSSGKRVRKDKIKSTLQNVCEHIFVDFTEINAHFKAEDYGFSLKLLTSNAEEAEIKEASRVTIARRILRVKDTFRLPFKALQALRTKAGLQTIPTERVLQEESRRLAACLPVIPITTIASKDGCLRPMSDVLEFLLDLPEHRHRLHTDDNDIKITLRFACDGAKITKYKNSVRGVCKLIHPPGTYYSNKDSPDDEITLFVYMGEEKRPAFENASATTFQQMRHAAETGVRVKGKNIKVEWLFCSDWKAMQMVKGINAANSKYFCMWCLCTKESIADFSKTWGVERNAVQQGECLTTKTTQDDRCGYQHPDLLSWIPYSNVIPDELHVRLRITTKLLNQVVVWAVSQQKTAALLDEMQRIKVDFRIYEEQGDDKKGCIKRWTQLGGNALNKVLKNLSVITVLEKGPRDVRNLEKLPKPYLQRMLEESTGKQYPKNSTKDFFVQELRRWSSDEEQRELIANCPASKSRTVEDGATPQPALPGGSNKKEVDPTEIQMLWRDFDRLMESIKAPKDADNFLSPEQFHKAAKSWAMKFREETLFGDVIPYIHALVYHVPEAMRRHGYLPHIGISQVERKNYDQHLAYFQGTSKEGGRTKKKVTVQILERENRQLFHRRFPQGEEPTQVEEMED